MSRISISQLPLRALAAALPSQWVSAHAVLDANPTVSAMSGCSHLQLVLSTNFVSGTEDPGIHPALTEVGVACRRKKLLCY